jgi:hypothetical protein
VSLFVLQTGLDASVLPESYLLFGLLLLLEGDRLMAASTAQTGGRRRIVQTVFRYLVRPVWLALGAGVVLKLLGIGAIANVSAGVDLFHPVTVGLACLVVVRLAGWGATHPLAGSPSTAD